MSLVTPPHNLANPRTCAPPDLTRFLAELAEAPALGIVLDFEAVSQDGALERPLVLALDAVTHAATEVVLVSRAVEPPAELSRVRCVGPVPQRLAAVRALLPESRLIVIGDDLALFDELGEHDRGLSVGRAVAHDNVVATGMLAVRAALWWIVNARDRERRNSSPLLGSAVKVG